MGWVVLGGRAEVFLREFRERAVVARLQPARHGIFDDLRPYLVALADGDRVEMFGGFIGTRPGMRSAHDRGDAALATGGRDLVGSRRAA